MNFSWINSHRKIVVAAIVFLILASSVAAYVMNDRPPTAEEPVFSDYPIGVDAIDREERREEQVELISIDLKGAVLHQGVYELPERSRVIDAIEKAGGFADDAELKAINLAERLQDGQMIYVPKIGEWDDEKLLPSALSESRSNERLISINRADEAQLTQLPGIGPARAASIIAFREERGKFNRKEDLMQISGIGPKTFERLKDLIIVD